MHNDSENINSEKLTKNSVLYLLAMVLPRAVNFITISLYTYHVAPAEYGIYGYTATIGAFLSVLSCMDLNVYYLRTYGLAEDKKTLNGTIYWLMALWNIVLTVLSLCLMPLVWRLLDVSFSYWPYVPLMLVGHFFTSFEILPTRTYRLKGEAKYYLIRILTRTSLNVGLCAMFLLGLKNGIVGRYYADIICSVVFGIVFIFYMRRNSYFKIDLKIAKEALKFSLPIVPSDLLNAAIPMINTMLIASYLDMSSLGIYTVGLSLASVVSMLTTAITFTFEPEFYLRSAKPDFPRYAKKIKDIQIVIVVWICCGCGLFVREAAMLFLSDRYWNSWQVVQIMAVYYFLVAIGGYLYGHAAVQGRTKSITFACLGNFIILVVSSIILLPIFGSNALGWTNCLGILTQIAIQYALLERNSLKGSQFTRDYFLIAATIILFIISRPLHSLSIWICILLKVFTFAVYSFLLLALYKIRIKDIWENTVKKLRKRA